MFGEKFEMFPLPKINQGHSFCLFLALNIIYPLVKAKFKPICIELVNKQLHNYYEVYLDHGN